MVMIFRLRLYLFDVRSDLAKDLLQAQVRHAYVASASVRARAHADTDGA